MPPNPDVLDGVGQLLLIREIRPTLDLVYHDSWAFNDFVKFINRAKDELVTPDDFDGFVAARSASSSKTDLALGRCRCGLATNGRPRPDARRAQGLLAAPTHERAERRPRSELGREGRGGDREARRTVAGDGTRACS